MCNCTQMLRYRHCGLVCLCSQRSQDTFRYGVLELRRTPLLLQLLAFLPSPIDLWISSDRESHVRVVLNNLHEGFILNMKGGLEGSAVSVDSPRGGDRCDQASV
ncbi:hypothetical protein CIP100275_01947 [Corynebacterium diphtheriae]|nr:hypothetical protein CIP100294_01826 [Corynebacterium diphtheriae]CAB0521316.1 hypothetical protein CIP102550_01813 [Corynebacterium diphtheriae]CAB0523412.1 hypothetical protein CIP100275_01947 [Corynebacterium diphtheriae]